MSAGHAADTFFVERPRLLGLAYRMLGSIADAEDVVQDAWLRWEGADQAAIERPAAWLTTVTTRLALDRVRSVARRREDYVGPWLPEPVSTTPDPEAGVELAESLTLGFLVLLDRLTPTERAVFLLADVFREPFASIAAAVGRSEEACRQVASRARRKVRDASVPAVSAADRNLLGRLVGAVASGNVQQVVALCDPSVVLISDGGPDRHAARRPVIGPDRVARFLVNVAARNVDLQTTVEEINGAPALVMRGDRGTVVIQAGCTEGRVSAIWTLLNPTKLLGVDSPPAIV